jgi:hypothetical protein
MDSQDRPDDADRDNRGFATGHERISGARLIPQQLIEIDVAVPEQALRQVRGAAVVGDLLPAPETTGTDKSNRNLSLHRMVTVPLRQQAEWTN